MHCTRVSQSKNREEQAYLDRVSQGYHSREYTMCTLASRNLIGQVIVVSAEQ